MAQVRNLCDKNNIVKRNPRGPLRALHMNVVNTTEGIQETNDVDACTNSTISETWVKVLGSDINLETDTTLILRARDQCPSPQLQQSFQNNFSHPLRASSYRANKSPKKMSTNAAEDIRHHFRVRAGSCNQRGPVSVKLSSENSECAQLSPGDCGMIDRSTWSLTSLRHVTRKRRASQEIADELCSERKQKCFSDAGVKPTMGADVKAHPRYRRRGSGADATELLPHVITRPQPFSPICPVPMPTSFPPLAVGNQIPKPDRSPVIQRTVETQTSPPQPDILRSTEDSHCRSLRQSFGSSQVLTSLKCTFGNLRRAISTGRLRRNSNESSGKKPSGLASFHQSTTSSTATTGSNFRFPRIGSKRRRTSGRVSCQTTCSETQVDEPNSSVHDDSSLDGQILQSMDSADSLTCHVIAKYPDGSVRVQLRRPNTTTRFGFFVARDAQGIYISRLGSVRCVAKLWNTLHVGDRILEVQGVPCASLEVNDVHNLIRGCELAEFVVRST